LRETWYEHHAIKSLLSVTLFELLHKEHKGEGMRLGSATSVIHVWCPRCFMVIRI